MSPNQPKTPQRAFRAPDELWKPALAKARQNGETLTDVLIRALRDYVESETNPQEEP